METYYTKNINRIWDSLIPPPNTHIIQKDGTIKKIEATFQETFLHYLSNVAKLTLSLVALPFTFGYSYFEATPLTSESERVGPHFLKAYGFANSGFQDGGIGTGYDPSSLNGIGVCDWDKVLRRQPQIVTNNGEKITPITQGVTLLKDKKIEDLFINTIDHPKKLAKLLRHFGCTAYRTCLERSVLEPAEGKFSDFAIEKYKAFFKALKDEGIEPWVTLHHFTNPQWFEEKGDFLNEENINGFVSFAEKMVDFFPMVQNWMTFNEPGVRGLEAYVRGEHPPQKQDIDQAAHLIRNLLVTHVKTYKALKTKNESLNIGITHQWLKFLPYSDNLIEKGVALFYTNIAHAPIFNFLKTGVMEIKVPFLINVKLQFEDETAEKIADFLGVQNYGFPRVKIGLNGGIPFPGASGKTYNFYRFTVGSTCGEGGSMQYFGPPSNPKDLETALNEAFSIPQSRVSAIGISEAGSDAKRMDYGETEFKIDNKAQSESIAEIFKISERFPLQFLFLWTLNRHCEWLSGGVPHIGLTELTNRDTYIRYEENLSTKIVKDHFYNISLNNKEKDVS